MKVFSEMTNVEQIEFFFPMILMTVSFVVCMTLYIFEDLTESNSFIMVFGRTASLSTSTSLCSAVHRIDSDYGVVPNFGTSRSGAHALVFFPLFCIEPRVSFVWCIRLAKDTAVKK